MKKIILLLLITFLSCSKDDNNDCLAAKQQIIDEYNELIQLALDEGNAVQAQTLKRNRDIRLEEFDC